MEACTKDGSNEVVRSKGVVEGIEAKLEGKLEGMGLTESEERVKDDWGNQKREGSGERSSRISREGRLSKRK